MDQKDRQTEQKVISLKTFKLKKKHKRFFDFLCKIKKLFKKDDSNNNKTKRNGYSNTVNR